MALIVEDGTGKADAESYASVATVDSFFTDRGLSWPSGYTETQKEIAARTATQWLDGKYRSRWSGEKGSAAQALLWPRSDATEDGFAVTSTIVPASLVEACCLAAEREANETGGLMAPIDKVGRVKKERNKVGPIEQEIEYSGGKSNYKHFPAIQIAIAGLLHSSNRIVRA